MSSRTYFSVRSSPRARLSPLVPELPDERLDVIVQPVVTGQSDEQFARAWAAWDDAEHLATLPILDDATAMARHEAALRGRSAWLRDPAKPRAEQIPT